MVLAVVALAAFGYFAFGIFQGSLFTYLSVDELVSEGASLEGKSIKVVGSLVEYSFQREGEDSLRANFQLESGGARVDATYDGVLDDLFFNPHSEITLTGTLGEDGVFTADVYNIKCPSKYESLDVENPYDPVPPALAS